MGSNPANEVTNLLGTSAGSGSGGAPVSALTEQLTSLTQQIQQLQTINQQQIQTEQENTQALAQSASKSSGGSQAGSIGSTIESVLGFGLGLSPLISGLVSLFGGGGQSQPASLVPYVMPPAVQASGGISASQQGAFGVDTADGGLPRPQASSSAATTTQVTVQVQAMDSQSFLDHSNDIAQAVKQAMLESSVLNDVIRGYKVANFPTLKSGAVAQYPSDRSQNFATNVLRFVDGSEQRFPGYAKALRSWTIRLDLLDESELVALEQFFVSQVGRAGVFAFTDPFDGSVANCRFGSDQLELTCSDVGAGKSAVVIQEVGGGS
jgi:hypothetical protein